MGWYVGVRHTGTAKIFPSSTKPTKADYPEYEFIMGSFRSKDSARIGLNYALHEHERRTIKINPPSTKAGVIIYDDILEIRARKGGVSLWPKQNFVHKFKKGSQVIGLRDGSILIKSTKGRKLWKIFDY